MFIKDYIDNVCCLGIKGYIDISFDVCCVSINDYIYVDISFVCCLSIIDYIDYFCML